jgi:hypothetical protein
VHHTSRVKEVILQIDIPERQCGLCTATDSTQTGRWLFVRPRSTTKASQSVQLTSITSKLPPSEAAFLFVKHGRLEIWAVQVMLFRCFPTRCKKVDLTPHMLTYR